MNFTNEPIQTLLSIIHYPQWTIQDWRIAFLFSDRVFTDIRKQYHGPDWYEDPVVGATYIELLNECFLSIQRYHATFGGLPQVGDRLYNADTGMRIQDRSIDGSEMRITFVVNL